MRAPPVSFRFGQRRPRASAFHSLTHSHSLSRSLSLTLSLSLSLSLSYRARSLSLSLSQLHAPAQGAQGAVRRAEVLPGHEAAAITHLRPQAEAAAAAAGRDGQGGLRLPGMRN